MSGQVRVRFAPSPTGFLHIGGVRTALFNFLLARKERGAFLLRIEDTDRERSRPEFEKEILDSLLWLGLKWDGPIVRQSERLEIYRKACEALFQKGLAYEVEEAGKKAVRFRIPKRSTAFQDLVHGRIEFDAALLDDLVILKSDGFPTYHFACVVDDHEMEITHVIRGDDHVSNTPRQVLLYEAFGWTPPQFGHLPLVFGKDKAPLSKRHGAVALTAYQKEGYLPDGILNYLALLGWSSGGNQEIFNLNELISKFNLKGVNKTNACFDPEKLKWTNGEHIRKLSDQSYLKHVEAFFDGTHFSTHPEFSKIALLYKTRIRTFQELSEQTYFFLTDEVQFDFQSVQKYLSDEKTKGHLSELHGALSKQADFSNPAELEKCVRQTAERLGADARALIHPVRVALSGKSVTAGLFEVMVLLGKEAVLKRIQYVIIHFNVILSEAKNL